MKKKIIVLFIVLLVIVIGVCSICYANSDAVQIRKQLDLGQKYLSELDYEQAIVVYEAVLDIDDSNIVAYLGMAESYASMGNYEKAVEILQTGYDITEDETIKGKCDEYQKIIDDIVAKKAEEEARKRAEEEKRIKNQERAKYAVVLKPIYDAVNAGDEATVFALMQEEAYLSMVKEYENAESSQPYYSPENVDFEDMSNGIAIYLEKNSNVITEGIQTYCYCGDYVDGMREGFGTWISININNETVGKFMNSGIMHNDYPNGNFYTHARWDNPPQKFILEFSVEGEYLNGIGNGKFIQKIIDGNNIVEFEYTLKDGYYELIGEETDGFYLAATDINGNTYYVKPDDRVYISGFGVENQ